MGQYDYGVLWSRLVVWHVGVQDLCEAYDYNITCVAQAFELSLRHHKLRKNLQPLLQEGDWVMGA